ncbi:transcriptional regulator, HxlR family [Paracoccus saliphilus]|uniref:Transcriptional regulator n=2 Tax=Paracoccus saliphilus TaxID=405559 RepID=A0AA46A497_9RHOB|nr:helix-turn-helix domain-containing protein [Paracoccus saliphilus]WCR03682.1 transcriptional regulator [Paracoccus saliphilus]SIS57820.1 transcriptional regulator, HxlR family [Paracoccus saliphilus]
MMDDGEKMRIRYDEGCLAAHALNVVGDRWALLVVRELMFAAKRFQVIRSGLPGISAGVLTQRLTQLETAGVARHDPNTGAYQLTESGRDLLPVLQAIGRWGAKHPGHDPRRFISPTALMVSMTAMVDQAAAQGRHITAGFRSHHEGFVMRLTGDGAARVEATQEIEADFVLEGDGNNLAAAVYGPTPLKDLATAGTITLTGHVAAAQRFVKLFSLRKD